MRLNLTGIEKDRTSGIKTVKTVTFVKGLIARFFPPPLQTAAQCNFYLSTKTKINTVIFSYSEMG